MVSAVDETTAAFRAASYAAGLARRTGSRLVLVHVQRPLASAVWMDAIYSTSLDRGASIEVPSALLSRLGTAIEQEYGIEVDTVILEGSLTAEIVALADDLRADAVVVGSSHSLRHRLVGSVSVRLVRRGKWPVTVVP